MKQGDHCWPNLAGVAMTRVVPRRSWEVLRWWPEAVLFVAALAVRMIPEMINGAVTGNYGYDPAVYFVAADSFIHGRMPYRDYILLHPPGVVLIDAPFAWLGSMTSDRAGFAALIAFFAILSATSAVLVTRVARRLGMPRRACLLAGTVYALWFGSLIAEYEPRLEPLGCFLLLCGLLALLASRQSSGSVPAVGFALLAGSLFGTAMSVKIWWTVPVLVLLAGELFAGHAARRVAAMVAGAAVAGVLIDGPFLLIAGSKMWTMVVLDQTGRPRNTPDVLHPLAYLVVGWPSVHSGETGLRIAVALGAGLLAVLVLRAWQVRLARIIVLMLLAQLAVIMVEPTWFQFYADYVTVALSLVVGAACVRRDVAVAAPADRQPAGTRDVSPWLATAIAVCLGAAIAWTVPETTLVRGVPAARLTAAAKGYRCVMTDSPMALIDMNRLTTQIRRGCPNLVDVTGLIFVLDHQDHRRAILRTWNTDMVSYLRSEDAVLLFGSPKAFAFTARTARLVEQDGVKAHFGQYDLYTVRHDAPPGGIPCSPGRLVTDLIRLSGCASR